MHDATVQEMDARPGWLLFPLVAGDALVFVAFAGLGRETHNLTAPNPLVATLLTAAPFAVAWLVVALAMGVMGGWQQALATPGRWLWRTVLTWAVALPLGLVIRSVWLGRPIVPVFALVTMATTALMVLVWRGVFWLAYRKLS